MCASHGGQAPQVKAAAKERLADLIDPDRALRTAAALAYSDVTELYTDDYKLKPLRDWPEHLRQAVKRFDPILANADPGDGASDRVLRMEFWDKPKALEMLFKNLGLYAAEKQELTIKAYKWKS